MGPIMDGTLGQPPPTRLSWSTLRLLGDAIHVSGVLVLIAHLLKKRSCAGISLKTQVLYFIIWICRYLDVLLPGQSLFLRMMKLFYIGTAVIVLLLFHKWVESYEKRKDTFKVPVLLFPCFTAAVLLTPRFTPPEIAWTYSEVLEGVALLPQYIFCYREGRTGSRGGCPVLFWILALGGYRFLYVLHWAGIKSQAPEYSDVPSWLGAITEVLLFADFLMFRFIGKSMLNAVLPRLDDASRRLMQRLEREALGKRGEKVDEEDDDSDEEQMLCDGRNEV